MNPYALGAVLALLALAALVDWRAIWLRRRRDAEYERHLRREQRRLR